MQFDAKTIEVRGLLSSGHKYVIPRYQREYSWEKTQHDDFFNDIVNQVDFENKANPTSDYFFGTTILIGDMLKSGEPIEIVDGQQRLTTFTIFLSVLSDILLTRNRKLSDKLWKYIIAEDDDGNEFVVLSNETAGSYFADKIQKRLLNHPEDSLEEYYENFVRVSEFDRIVENLTDEQKKIRDAYDYFYNKLSEDSLEEYIIRYSIEYEEILKILRDQLLKSQIIYICSTEEESVNVIFENINSKGKNLSTLDMIKNEIFAVEDTIVPKDDAKEIWSNITKNISSIRTSISKERFFRYFWISRYGKSSEKDLYQNFKHNINKSEYLDFLRRLEKSSKCYSEIFGENKEFFINKKWSTRDIDKLFYSINALTQYFSIQQTQLIILALYENYKEGRITTKYFKEILYTLEGFHYIYNAVTRSPNNKLESRYANMARSIFSISKGDLQKSSKQFKKELVGLLPGKEAFISDFLKISYRKKVKSQKGVKENTIAKYTVRKYEEILQANNSSLYGYSVEHIIPESDESTLNIGNLVLLEETLNREAESQDLNFKYTIYKKSSYHSIASFLNKYVSNGDISFTNRDFRERGIDIAESIYQYIVSELSDD